MQNGREPHQRDRFPSRLLLPGLFLHLLPEAIREDAIGVSEASGDEKLKDIEL